SQENVSGSVFRSQYAIVLSSNSNPSIWSLPGLTRQSILFAKLFLRRRWTTRTRVYRSSGAFNAQVGQVRLASSTPRVTAALSLRAERPCQQRFDRLVHARAAGENVGNRGCDRHVDALFLRHLDQHRRGEHAFGEHGFRRIPAAYRNAVG